MPVISLIKPDPFISNNLLKSHAQPFAMIFNLLPPNSILNSLTN